MIGVFTGRSYGQRVENVTFIRIETELVENLHLFQPSDWMVLTCLTMHIGQTNVCWPSLAKIATQTGLSEQTVKTAIKRLCTVTVGNQRVLAVCERRTASGRQTSNLYVVMPTGEQVAEFESQGEGTNFISEEGTDFIPPITLNKTHKELIPPIVPQRKKRDVQLPKTDDPAHQLFVMFRRARGWQDDYSVGDNGRVSQWLLSGHSGSIGHRQNELRQHCLVRCGRQMIFPIQRRMHCALFKGAIRIRAGS